MDTIPGYNFPEYLADLFAYNVDEQSLASLVPLAARQDAARKMAYDYCKELQENIAKGYILTIELLQLEKGLDSSPFRLSKEQIDKLMDTEILRALACQQTTKAKILGFDNDALCHIYKVGFDLFQQQKCNEAIAVFTYLTVLDPRIPAVWSGIGCAYESLKRQAEAFTAFAVAAILQPDTIESYLPLAKQLIEHGLMKEAKNLFEKVIEICSQQGHSDVLDTLAQEAKQYANAL